MRNQINQNSPIHSNIANQLMIKQNLKDILRFFAKSQILNENRRPEGFGLNLQVSEAFSGDKSIALYSVSRNFKKVDK